MRDRRCAPCACGARGLGLQEKYESHIETHRGTLLFYGVLFCLVVTMMQWFALLQVCRRHPSHCMHRDASVTARQITPWMAGRQLERLGAAVGAPRIQAMRAESAKARQLTVGLFGAVFASLFMLALASGCLCLLLCLPVVPPTPASLTPISRRSFVALSIALHPHTHSPFDGLAFLAPVYVLQLCTD